MISSYFQLTTRLVEDLVKESLQSLDEWSQTSAAPTLALWTVKAGATVHINVAELAASLVLVNFVYPELDNKVESVVVDWLARPVAFPSEAVSDEIVAWFRGLIKSNIESKVLFEKELATDRRPVANRTPPEAVPGQVSIDLSSSRTRPSDMPDFEDELEMRSSARPSHAPSTFPTIGDGDLNPAGISPCDGLRPFDPLRTSDGGMYPSHNHPLFGTGRSGSRLGVPPGARFDDPLSEDNLEDLGAGLPGNLRRGFGPRGFEGPGSQGGYGGSFGGSFGGGF